MVAATATGLSYDAISSYAGRIGSHYDIYEPSGRADVHALVTLLGGEVSIAETDESLHVVEEGDFTVFVPQFTSGRRDRFTIAHELGHYFLHYIYPKKLGEMSFSRGSSDRAETQANVFAASLLMPRDAFAAAWAKYDGDAWALARIFEVSPRAAEVRGQVLRLS